MGGNGTRGEQEKSLLGFIGSSEGLPPSTPAERVKKAAENSRHMWATVIGQVNVALRY